MSGGRRLGELFGRWASVAPQRMFAAAALGLESPGYLRNIAPRCEAAGSRFYFQACGTNRLS